MIEILYLNLQFLIFIVYFNTYTQLIRSIKITKFLSIYDLISINILIQFIIFLIISFFKINIELFFYFNLIISLFFIFKFNFYKEYLNLSSLIFYIIGITIFLSIARFNDLGWDGLAHWIYKVNLFNVGGSLHDFDSLPFPSYPHLGSFIWSFFWQNSVLDYEYIGRLFIPFIYIVSIFALCRRVKNNNLFYLLSFLIIFFNYDLFLFSGYQEYICFSIILIMSRFYILGDVKKNFYLIFFVFIMGSTILIWTKDESLFFSIFISIALLIKMFRNKKFIYIYSILFFLIITLSYFIEIYFKGSFDFQSEFDLNLVLSRINFEYIFNFIYKFNYHFVVALFKYPLSLVSIISIYICIKKNILDKSLINGLIVYLVLNYLFLNIVYFSTPYSLEEMLANSTDRLIFQISGFIIFPLIEIFSFYNKKFNYF